MEKGLHSAIPSTELGLMERLHRETDVEATWEECFAYYHLDMSRYGRVLSKKKCGSGWKMTEVGAGQTMKA